MANAEHLAHVKDGWSAFNKWRENEHINVDLSFAELSKLELCNMDLRNANVRGANLQYVDLRNANLEGACLVGCDLRGADLSAANLSRANLRDSMLDGVVAVKTIFYCAELDNASLRKSHFVGANLNNASLNNAICSEAHFFQANLTKSQLCGATGTNSYFREARLLAADLTGANFTGGDFEKGNLTEADLTDALMVSANLKGAIAIRARVVRTKLSDASLEFVDLSGAILESVDLATVALSTAVLAGTRITNSIWPLQRVSADWIGRLRVPQNLPIHPIQDVVGLPAVLRREIADAQYLVDFKRRCDRRFSSRLFFRLWGLTCNYGQSALSWSLWSMLIICGFGFLFSTLQFNIAASVVESQCISPADSKDSAATDCSNEKKQAVATVARPSFPIALYLSIMTFTTLGFGDVIPVSNVGRSLISLEVIIGYLMLGGLISIIANRFTRLS